MKHRVSELEGALLDAAVAKCEGWIFGGIGSPAWPSSSTLWRIGGPIIERERIELRYSSADWWGASIFSTEAPAAHGRGPTPLIAAMRAFCASRFGEEVEL